MTVVATVRALWEYLVRVRRRSCGLVTYAMSNPFTIDHLMRTLITRTVFPLSE